MKRKWGLAVVLMVACVVLLCIGVAADTVAEGTCGENLTWVLDDAGVLTISGEGEMEDYDKSAKAPWFTYTQWGRIYEIFVTEGIDYIGNYAFYNCTLVRDIYLPESLISIGDNAFRLCPTTVNIHISSNVNCSQDTFSGVSLQSISFTNNVDMVNEFILEITSLQFFNVDDTDGKGLVAIDGVLYDYDNNYDSYTLIRYPPAKAGDTYNIVDNTELIGYAAFKNCDLLNRVDIADSVLGIQNFAFSYCDNLSTLKWGESISTVDDSFSVFYLTEITTIILPKELTIVPSISTVTNYFVLNDQRINYYDIDGVLFYNRIEENKPTLIKYPLGRTTTHYTVPLETVEIGCEAFSRNDSIKTVSLPLSIKHIGTGAFSFCSALTEIQLNDGLLQIDEHAFMYCNYLRGINFPNSLTSIGASAFCHCTFLKTVSIPEQIKSIGVCAFQDCSALREAYFYGTAPTYISEYSNTFSNTHSTFTIYYIEGKSGWTTPTWNGYNTATFVPEDQYAAGVTAPATATAKDTVYVTLTTQNAYDSVTIEMSVNGLEYDEGHSSTNGGVVSVDGNMLTLLDVPRNDDMSYKLAFTVPKAGTATVQLLSATFTDADGNEVSGILSPAKATITVAELYHTVTISDVFTGETTVLDGTDYTFTTDPTYDYADIAVTMAGMPVDITNNRDGSYTIANVTGALVITGSRTPKECTITFDYPNASDSTHVTVPYGRDSYVYVQWNVFCTVFSAVYADGTTVSVTVYPTLYYNDILDKPYTYVVIPGPITQDVTITYTTAPQKTAVALSGMSYNNFTNYSAYTDPGMDYTLILADTVTGSYKVTAEMNDVLVPVIQNGRSYTISGSDITEGLLGICFTKSTETSLTLNSTSPYKITADTIVNVPTNTTASAFLDQFTNTNIAITTAAGTSLSGTDLVGTGCVVSLTVDGTVVDSRTILVTGDLTGDGRMDANDLLPLQQYYSGYAVTIDHPLAADLNGDGKLTRADAMIMARKLAGWKDATTPPTDDIMFIE